MPIFALNNDLIFPPVSLAEPDGLLAVGGDLSPERLILAYESGIFPWYNEDTPILWHAPARRCVLETHALKVARSLRQTIRKQPFELTMDTAFREVVQACAEIPRPGQDGTWITDEMLEAYARLHELGLAHSIESWQDGELVGGLYGVSLGGAYFGESMFARVSDASKVAFVLGMRQLEAWGITLIDCQVYTKHLARFGAVMWPRRRYMKALRVALKQKTKSGRWRFEPPFSS